MANQTTNKSIEALEDIINLFHDACNEHDIPSLEELMGALYAHGINPSWSVCGKTILYWITHPFDASCTLEQLKMEKDEVPERKDEAVDTAPTYIYETLSSVVDADASRSKADRLRELAISIADLYAAKNHDYGDSFGQSVQAYGLVAALTRISDKFHRLEGLVLGKKAQVNDEGLRDTLLDLATYALMTTLELDQ